MDLNIQLAELSREELYKKVWSIPGSKLAEEFGLSDVAIAKRCKKLNIPRPTRGYWAKLQAGRKVRKPPLPPTPEEVFARSARKKFPLKKLPPPNAKALHPLAFAFHQALRKEKATWDKRVRLQVQSLPDAIISPDLIPRTAQAFHVILEGIEPVGIRFEKSRSIYEGGQFRIGRDQLFFKIEEGLEFKPAGNSGGKRDSANRPYGESRVPCGKLSFKIHDSRYRPQMEKLWTEEQDGTLLEILRKIVTGIRNYFVETREKRAQDALEQEKRHLEWEQRQREYEKQQAIQEEANRRKKNAKAIRKVVRKRRDDLLKAAEWWRLHKLVLDFIADTEKRWLASCDGLLNPAQTKWLAWAHQEALTLSPDSSGYPDPSIDGPFAMDSVPFGGPYPETRDFTRPPTMPKIPEPAVEQKSYGNTNPTPQPYPFWLKHQGR